jgi:hypothetical protein
MGIPYCQPPPAFPPSPVSLREPLFYFIFFRCDQSAKCLCPVKFLTAFFSLFRLVVLLRGGGRSQHSPGRSEIRSSPRASSPPVPTGTVKASVEDPDPQDPHVVGHPGSGSICQRYGSGSFPFLIKVLSGLK